MIDENLKLASICWMKAIVHLVPLIIYSIN
jgi:hypothetical protein